MSRTTRLLVSTIVALIAVAGLTGWATAAAPTKIATTAPPPPPNPNLGLTTTAPPPNPDPGITAPPPAPTPTAPSGPAAGAGSELSGAPSLTRIYRGDDGGALYLRQLGSDVYGFGEHPGRDYAYVLKGTVAGDRITGSWWDVPKDGRELSGGLDLRWSQGGARIVRSGSSDFGPDVFQSISPNGISWPVRQAAGFQSTTQGDLDGAFQGDDASRHYLRQSGSTIVWVAERAAQPDERPGWVSVFVGTRSGGAGVSGTWVDVPKGLETRSGTVGAGLVGTTRSLMLAQTGASRTKRLDPDYALDWDAFAGGIESALDDNVVGYAYAIKRNGGFMRMGAWGSRRLEIDGGKLPFTVDTQAFTASTAKLVSATAIVKALHDRGLTVDARVAPFLPSCIEKGPGISTLTFREILNHRSGLSGARGFDTQGSCNGRDPF
ncbi:MAG: serine hydrolase, partial [Actinobacteria bacterium]|nr:serine hydrolase [Actinomycetota bacterium]